MVALIGGFFCIRVVCVLLAMQGVNHYLFEGLRVFLHWLSLVLFGEGAGKLAVNCYQYKGVF